MNKAYEYCKANYRRKTTPKYVKLQMRDFMRICEGKDKKYIISNKKLKQVENIIKNEVLKIKGNNYNYKFVMNEILYCALDEVDYNSKQITENLLLETTKLYFEIQDKEKQLKMSLITDDIPF